MRLPKDSNVGQLLAELRGLLPAAYSSAPLRLLEIYMSKIYKVLSAWHNIIRRYAQAFAMQGLALWAEWFQLLCSAALHEMERGSFELWQSVLCFAVLLLSRTQL